MSGYGPAEGPAPAEPTEVMPDSITEPAADTPPGAVDEGHDDQPADAAPANDTAPAAAPVVSEPAGDSFESADLSPFGGFGEKAGQVLLSNTTDNPEDWGDLELWSSAEAAAELRQRQGEGYMDPDDPARGDISDQARDAMMAAERARFNSLDPSLREDARENHEEVLAYIESARNPGHVAAMLDAVGHDDRGIIDMDEVADMRLNREAREAALETADADIADTNLAEAYLAQKATGRVFRRALNGVEDFDKLPGGAFDTLAGALTGEGSGISANIVGLGGIYDPPDGTNTQWLQYLTGEAHEAMEQRYAGGPDGSGGAYAHIDTGVDRTANPLAPLSERREAIIAADSELTELNLSVTNVNSMDFTLWNPSATQMPAMSTFPTAREAYDQAARDIAEVGDAVYTEANKPLEARGQFIEAMRARAKNARDRAVEVSENQLPALRAYLLQGAEKCNELYQHIRILNSRMRQQISITAGQALVGADGIDAAAQLELVGVTLSPREDTLAAIAEVCEAIRAVDFDVMGDIDASTSAHAAADGPTATVAEDDERYRRPDNTDDDADADTPGTGTGTGTGTAPAPAGTAPAAPAPRPTPSDGAGLDDREDADREPDTADLDDREDTPAADLPGPADVPLQPDPSMMPPAANPLDQFGGDMFERPMDMAQDTVDDLLNRLSQFQDSFDTAMNNPAPTFETSAPDVAAVPDPSPVSPVDLPDTSGGGGAATPGGADSFLSDPVDVPDTPPATPAEPTIDIPEPEPSPTTSGPNLDGLPEPSETPVSDTDPLPPLEDPLSLDDVAGGEDAAGEGEGEGDVVRDINGSDVTFPNEETAKLYDALASGDGSSSLRDLAESAGFGEVGKVGEDIGVQIPPSELQPGDIASVDGKDYMWLGDDKLVDSAGQVISKDDLPPFDNVNQGWFRLDDGELASDETLGAVGGESLSGDAGAGDAGAGDAGAGDAGAGDAGTGDSGAGDAGTGDSGSTASVPDTDSGTAIPLREDAPVGMGAGQNVPGSEPVGGPSSDGAAAGADPTGVVPGGTPVDDPNHGLDGDAEPVETPIDEPAESDEPDESDEPSESDAEPQERPGRSEGTPGMPEEDSSFDGAVGGSDNIVTGSVPNADPLGGGSPIDLSRFIDR